MPALLLRLAILAASFWGVSEMAGDENNTTVQGDQITYQGLNTKQKISLYIILVLGIGLLVWIIALILKKKK